MCKKDEGIVMSNFAALRAAVFPLLTKNLRGADIRPPSVSGLTFCELALTFNHAKYRVSTLANSRYLKYAIVSSLAKTESILSYLAVSSHKRVNML